MTTVPPTGAEDVLDTQEAGPTAIRGSALRMGAYTAGVALAFASAPLLIRHLGVSDFGRYTLVASLLALVTGLTDAGLVSVAQREWVNRRGEARREVLRQLLGLRLVLSAVAVLVAVGFAAVAGYGETLVAGTAVAGVGFLLLGAQSIYAVPLLADLRLGRVTVVDLIRQFVTVGLIIGLVLADASLFWFLALGLPVALVVTVMTAWLVRGEASLTPALDRAASWALLRDVIPFAAAMAITAVYFRITLVILDLVESDLEVGYYATSFRVLEVVIAVPALLISAVFPVMARAAEGDDARLRYVVGRVIEVGLLLGPWFTLCLVLGADLVMDLLGGEDAAPAADVLRLQAPAVIATFVAVGCAFPLLSLRRHREVLVANVAALVASVTLTLALGPVWGAEGAAVATVAAELMLALTMAVMLRRVEHELRLPLHVLPAVVLACALAAATALLPVPDAVVIAAATVVYFGVLGALGRIPWELRDAARR